MTRLATNILEQNLEALSRTSPDTVRAIRACHPRGDVEFLDTADGVPSARVGVGVEARLLASARRPLDEASRLIGPIDIQRAAVFAVMGFGMGYHVAELSRRVGKRGGILVFEPDIPLLHAVLGRVDHAGWIRDGNVCVLTDADDGAAIGQAMEGIEGFVGMGVTQVAHPASGPRLGNRAKLFHDRLAAAVTSVNMTVMTTVGQAHATIRNLLQNVDIYAMGEGVAALAGACAGRPAIVVSAGPSLQRNIALLEDPAVRQRCVIIAAQTVLKPLLSRAIRPHFVTALDVSEISGRFYEGLSAEAVRGISLVVEPKTNARIPESWARLSGRILCLGDATLDLLLGDPLSGQRGVFKRGATVAHLAYYLARHLGCDPVALVGQDLGFTDGQYYSAGAAIHGVWACELNEFKSLELLEWQRIARMGNLRMPATDTLGRAMYTDQQMHSYLKQFEVDFRDDAARGLTTIDATEGGVRKEHARVMPLREFLDRHADGSRPSIDALLGERAHRPHSPHAPAWTRERLVARVREVRAQIGRLAGLSRKTGLMLTEIREHQKDQARVDRLITRIDAVRDEVETLQPGLHLTQLLGQLTVFNRVRRDRHIELQPDLTDLDRQRLQVERDIDNVHGLACAADELGAHLDKCSAMLRGGPRETRDIPKSEHDLITGASAAEAARLGATPTITAAPAAVCAIVPVDLEYSGPGWRRSLAGPFEGRKSLLAATVDRLLASPDLADIVVFCRDADAARDLLEPRQLAGGRLRVERNEAPSDERRRRAIATGRLWARACWRGGLGDMTCFDELLVPRECLAVMQRLGADAALLVGADWVAVDPELSGHVIGRFRHHSRRHRLTFSQAAPGLCGCVIARSLVEDLACEGSERLGAATLGGLLGYLPAAPLYDLIGHPICHGLAGPTRDCGLRLVADTPRMRAALEHVLGAAEGGASLPAEAIAQRAAELLAAAPSDEAADELIVAQPSPDIARNIRRFAAGRPDRVVSFGDARWDPLGEGGFFDWIAAAREAGIAGVHVRTRLRADDGSLERLLASADVISVDCEAKSAGDSTAGLERLLALRRRLVGDDGMAVPWIVPRLTRCDAAYEHTEAFVNRWVSRPDCGWAALDPLHAPREGERIAPLPLPGSAAARLARTRRVL